MGITSADIVILASQVMADVPEGGGGPSGNVIADGSSNGIFPDISDRDRAGGRVNIRKLHLAIRTPDVDGYYGANLIIAEPYKDPRVSVTLFTTGSTFDRRTDIADRMESYLAKGAAWPGYLYGDHIAGQRTVTLLQRDEAPLPTTGTTLMLRKFEGLPNQADQYIRVIDVSSTKRTFTDGNGDFSRTQVVLTLSDALLADFSGFDALRLDAAINYTGRTKTFDTVVADAATYRGVVGLREAAALGSFTVQATSIYTQLVPSTRVETPIADARVNQQLALQVAAGASVTRTLNLGFTTGQSLFVGGQITPGAFSIARGGITLTDKGGLLMNGTTQVGLVDYANGVAALTSNVFGTAAGTHTVTFTPAASPALISDTLGLPVTKENQRLSWVVTLAPTPLKQSLRVSYMALGRWYVLSEDGSGAVRGADSAFGAGTLNFATGTLTLTLGAMPDVGSRVMLSWGTPAPVSALAAASAGVTPDQATGMLGVDVTVPGSDAIKPGTLLLSWDDGVARTSSDLGAALSGDATGPVRYSRGGFTWRPNVLPPAGTEVTVAATKAGPTTTAIPAMTDEGSNWGFTMSAPVAPGSVRVAAKLTLPMRRYPGTDADLTVDIELRDDGAGALLRPDGTSVGSVDYATGAGHIVKSTALFASTQPTFSGYDPLAGTSVFGVRQTGGETRYVTAAVGAAVSVTYVGTASAGSIAFTFTVDHLTASVAKAAQYDPTGAGAPWQSVGLSSFTLGSGGGTVAYSVSAGVVQRDPSPTTGQGTAVGTVGGSVVTLTAWPAGVAPVMGGLAGVVAGQAAGDASATSPGTSQVVGAATLRTAIAPLAPGGFSVAGTWLDGTVFTATSDLDGKIATGTAPVDTTPGSYGVFGIVDNTMGIADLRFGRRVPDSMATQVGVVDCSSLGLPGITYIQLRPVQADTLRYNAVGYTYLPIDPVILGLNTVRLPPDGRVPIFRPSDYVVIGHTGKIGPVALAAGQIIDCGRERLSRVRFVGADGLVINSGYTADLDLGRIAIDDVTGWAQPVTIQHRIEDMRVVRDVQINGQLTFTAPVSHNFPLGSYVSSALVGGDLNARAQPSFGQVNWTSVWSDTPIGGAAGGTFNELQNPITVTNAGAMTERWAIVFTGSTSFQVRGEHLGVIATGNTGADCAPMNPTNPGHPYFAIPAVGWGLGWAVGNVLRFNTVGAGLPFDVVRTILPGPETVAEDDFLLLARGGVDRP